MIKVILIKEGVHKRVDPPNDKIINRIDPICSSVVLIKGEKIVLVDTGQNGFEEEILKGLEENGVKPEDVDIIVNTHYHPDHCANNYLFKNAIRINQNILASGKWLDVYKEPIKEVMEGVEIIQTPGHSHRDSSVVVRAEKLYIIAGDAIIEGIIRKNSFTNEQERASAKKILEMAEVIIPGHNRIIKGEVLEELKELIKKNGL